MDIIQIIIGRFLVELLGASIRYSYTYLGSKLTGKEVIPFSKFWSSQGDRYKKLETEAGNRIAGLIFFVIFFIILVKLTV